MCWDLPGRLCQAGLQVHTYSSRGSRGPALRNSSQAGCYSQECHSAGEKYNCAWAGPSPPCSPVLSPAESHRGSGGFLSSHWAAPPEPWVPFGVGRGAGGQAPEAGLYLCPARPVSPEEGTQGEHQAQESSLCLPDSQRQHPLGQGLSWPHILDREGEKPSVGPCWVPGTLLPSASKCPHQC